MAAVRHYGHSLRGPLQGCARAGAGGEAANQDFLPKLQQYFVITKDSNDKVSHLELQRYFSDMPVRVLNGHLKRLGIEYDKNGMTNSIRKVYRGIRKYNQAELLEINGDDDPE